VFKRECSQCHRLEGVGYDLGLPLQNVKSRGGEGILIQILDPNREVNPSYLNYTILTVDGRLVTGVIQAETATSITLSRAEGERDVVRRTQIDEMRSTDLSIMPEGLETKITQAEMADLLAYLLTVME
jgi:putative heme-binding domain-containing protein